MICISSRVELDRFTKGSTIKVYIPMRYLLIRNERTHNARRTGRNLFRKYRGVPCSSGRRHVRRVITADRSVKRKNVLSRYRDDDDDDDVKLN